MITLKPCHFEKNVGTRCQQEQVHKFRQHDLKETQIKLRLT